MIVLFGAGAAGRYTLKFLRDKGEKVVAFADTHNFADIVEGLLVLHPDDAKDLYPDATWIACAISRPAAVEIRAQIKTMGVRTKPLYECLPVCHGLPPENIRESLFPILGDTESMIEFNDQCVFRKTPDYDYQIRPAPIGEIYFPTFIKRYENEHFLDAGACDGDTVKMFLARWKNYSYITALEPDRENYAKLSQLKIPGLSCFPVAVSDFTGRMSFTSNGDFSSRIDGDGQDAVDVVKIDDLSLNGLDMPPTYIKMDIEGSELEALWGARKLLRDHKPVLAICAYHKSEDLWKIPLLIHALQPEYKLFLRRYGEGAFELVWYAVPPERIYER